MVHFCFFPFRSSVVLRDIEGCANLEIALRVQTEQLSLRSQWQSERLQRNNGRKLLDDYRWRYG